MPTAIVINDPDSNRMQMPREQKAPKEPEQEIQINGQTINNLRGNAQLPQWLVLGQPQSQLVMLKKWQPKPEEPSQLRHASLPRK